MTSHVLPGELQRSLDIVLATVAENASEHDKDASFPVEFLDQLRATGLLGILVPRSFGGLGGTVRDVSRMCLEIGKEDLSAALIFGMHCQQVETLVRHGNAETLEDALPRIARGDLYIASVTTEQGKGGKILTAEAAIVDLGGDLFLDRLAPVVTGGTHADAFLVTMQSGISDTDSSVSLVLAYRDELGIGPIGQWAPVGMRASSSAGMTLTGKVPSTRVVGEAGHFHSVAATTFAPLAHITWSSSWLGTAAGAQQRTVELVRSGKTARPSESDVVAHRISRSHLKISIMSTLLDRVLDLYDDRESITLPSSQLLVNELKIVASEYSFQVVDELITALGMRYGYLTGSPMRLERAWRDLRSASLNFSNDRLHQVNGHLALLDHDLAIV